MPKQIIEIDTWLSESECSTIEKFCIPLPAKPTILPYGRFPNQLIANQRFIKWDAENILGKIIKPKLDLIFQNYHVDEAVFQELYLPWDVHCDLIRDTTGRCRPWQSILIPFETLDCATVIFEQLGEVNDFYLYKQTASKVKNPVDLKFWKDRMSHCWDEDREYLSINHVSKSWIRGNLLSFPRSLWHSSDNFHTRINKPKTFLQILIDQA